MNEKNKIPAVFKEDLQKLLETLNEHESILNGERSCLICAKTINYSNIQLLVPRSGKIFEYVCDNPICIEQYNHTKTNKP